jgi:Bacterial regulatory protein, Fis family
MDGLARLAPDPPALDEEQERILDALQTQPTKVRAAQVLGISKRTLYYRLEDPALREAYDTWRRAAVQDAFDAASTTTSEAMAVLYFIATDAEVPPAVRVQAASKLCDLGLKSVELEQVKRDVDELKAAVGL